jgi:hypothetical protein
MNIKNVVELKSLQYQLICAKLDMIHVMDDMDKTVDVYIVF